MNNGQKKCLCIIDLLKKSGPMTRKEVCKELKKAFPCDGELARSSWNWLLDKIEKDTPYRISFDKGIKKYVISQIDTMNPDDDSIVEYLMASYNVVSSAQMLMKHADKIYHADVITGTSAIGIILQAIDEQRGLTFKYTSFVNDTEKTRSFIPYFLCTWEGRWYLVAEADTHPGNLSTYALERMSDIRLSFEKVRRNIQITAEEYFRDSYGIQHAADDDAIDIVVRVYGTQVKYIRSKKIHPSQEEIKTCDEYSDFRLHLNPCYNFYQQLLWHREKIQVISPESVRTEIMSIIESINKNYHK